MKAVNQLHFCPPWVLGIREAWSLVLFFCCIITRVDWAWNHPVFLLWLFVPLLCHAFPPWAACIVFLTWSRCCGALLHFSPCLAGSRQSSCFDILLHKAFWSRSIPFKEGHRLASQNILIFLPFVAAPFCYFAICDIIFLFLHNLPLSESKREWESQIWISLHSLRMLLSFKDFTFYRSIN